MYVKECLVELRKEDFQKLIEGTLDMHFFKVNILNSNHIQKMASYATRVDEIRIEVDEYRKEKEKIEEITRQRKELERKANKSKKDQAERRKLVESQFGWDGSHFQLVQLVKKTMHDPSSFEHVETGFRDDITSIFIEMKYRGKNGFGALRTETQKARIDMEGNVLEVFK